MVRLIYLSRLTKEFIKNEDTRIIFNAGNHGFLWCHNVIVHMYKFDRESSVRMDDAISDWMDCWVSAWVFSGPIFN